MNPNLMNPEIILRSAHEREIDMRHESHALIAAESAGERLPAPKPAPLKRRRLTLIAVLTALVMR